MIFVVTGQTVRVSVVIKMMGRVCIVIKRGVVDNCSCLFGTSNSQKRIVIIVFAHYVVVIVDYIVVIVFMMMVGIIIRAIRQMGRIGVGL